jgi:hypothetical protein
MARRIVLNTAQKQPRKPWDPQNTLDRAIQERTRFLEKNPQYIEYQREIDRILDKAGNSENRMTVLALMMEAKLMELHGQLKNLNSILIRAAA